MGTLANINNTENWQRRGWAIFVVVAAALMASEAFALSAVGSWLR